MTKAQTEIIEILRKPEWMLCYDSVQAKASLWYEGKRLRTIPFKTYLAIKPHLVNVPNENFSTLKFYKTA